MIDPYTATMAALDGYVHWMMVDQLGGPLCPRHNRAKHRAGYQPRRDGRGHWHVYDHNGNHIA